MLIETRLAFVYFRYQTLLLFANIGFTTSGTHSQILGRAVKNEYIALGVFSTVFGGAWLSTRGAAKSAPLKPITVQQAKESVPVKADSA